MSLNELPKNEDDITSTIISWFKFIKPQKKVSLLHDDTILI